MGSQDQKAPRRSRKCAPKVKTGCLTCKIRRIKCDETRPSCIRCVSKGFVCDGYPKPIPAKEVPEDQCHQKQQTPTSDGISPGNDLVLSTTPALGLPSDEQDRRHFHHFLRRSAHEFSGLMDAPFWGQYVTRMSVSVPAIHHAVVALGALHEDYLSDRNGCNHVVNDRHEQLVDYSRRKYSKAIQTLNLQLCKTPGDEKMIEETLVACLLFICFEILQGNDMAALTHLEAGLQIFRKLCHPRPEMQLSLENSESSSVSSLANMFSRFDIQASSIMGSRPLKPVASTTNSVFPPPELSITRDLISTYSKNFITIFDARENLNILLAYIYQFLRSTARDCQYLPHLNPLYEKVENYPPLNCFPVTEGVLTNAYRERDIYIGLLRTWECKFHSLLESQLRCMASDDQKSRDNERHRECVNLHLTYLVTLIKLSTSLDPNETAYDYYLPQFKAIVQLADSLLVPLGNSVQRPERHASRTFTLESNIIHPLHFTAVKCRNSALRRRAVSLLQISGKEGVWDGDIMAKMAEHVISLEEEHMVIRSNREAGDPSLYVPDYGRVYGVGFDIHRTARKARLICILRAVPSESKKGETQWKKHDAEIPW